MAGPAWQSAPVYQAPGVIKGPPKEPPPQTAAQAQGDVLSNANISQQMGIRAATAPFDQQKAAADARRAGILADAAPAEAEKARAEAAKAKAEAEGVGGKATALDALASQIDRVTELYSKGFRGQGLLTPFEYIDSLPGNAQFNSAGAGMSDQALAAFRVPGVGAQSDRELLSFIQANQPTNNDPDAAIEEKLSNVRRRVDAARTARGLPAWNWRQPGQVPNTPGTQPLPVPGAKPPPDGDIGFSGRTDPDPSGPPLNPQQQQAYDAFNAANPNATPDQLRAFGTSIGVNIDNADAIIAARQQGAGVLPGSAAVYKTPDISDARGHGGAGEQVDAAIRGIADVPTMGLADEISALGDTVTRGGTYDENLRRQRAIDEYDSQNNFGFRTLGQLGGGLMLPSAGLRSGIGRLAGEGAGYGAAYGFGSGEGDIVDRGRNALVGGAIGGAGAAAAGGVGNALVSRFRRPGVGQAATDAVQAGEDVVPNTTPSSQADRYALMQAADRVGVQMMPADVGGVGTRMAAGAVGRTLGGIPMAEGADRAIGTAQAARDRIAGTLGTIADDAGAGQAAQRGARRFIDATQKRAGTLYERIPIQPGRRVVLGNTRQALGELTQGLESNPELSKLWTENPRLKATLDALTVKTEPMVAGSPGATPVKQIGTAIEGGNLSWQDMKRFRSIVGEIAGRPSLGDDGNQIAAMRKLYGALSEDMRATAQAEGPAALKAFNRANDYYRGREARIDGVLSDILGADFSKGEQAAFEQINRWAQRSGGDARQLGIALRSLGEDADTIRASLIGRMGQATPGRQNADGLVFSPAEFVTQWNKLSPRAKSSLFPNAEHRQALNDLARVNAGMKRATQFSNFSNTSIGTNAVAHVAGLVTNPLATIVIAGGEFGAGKLLASPRFARWLARAPKERNPRLHIQRLSTIAGREPAIAQEALGLQKWLLGAANDNATRVGSAAASPDQGPTNEQ